MNEPQIHFAKRNKPVPQRTNTVWRHLQRDRKENAVCQRLRRGGNGEGVFNGQSFILELEGANC